MAIVRVFLCTYRRNQLLRRAIQSLQDQSFSDWGCELHNDDPYDPFPSEYAAELGDPRLQVVNHSTNCGPTKSFNLMYRAGLAEKYVSLLEDDNWWEPEFLESMIAEMNSRPNLQLAWSNMKFWEEQADGSWIDTGKCIWEATEGVPQLFDWPQPKQIKGALHSNGAMLLRTEMLAHFRIPDSTPFAAIECVRERCFQYPLLFIPQPLANFAITRSTSRGNDRVLWGQSQALLAASFFKYVPLSDDEYRTIWHEARTSHPATSYIVPTLINGQCAQLIKYSKPIDWVRYLKGWLRRPLTNWRILRAKNWLPDVWATLDEQTMRLQNTSRHLNEPSQQTL